MSFSVQRAFADQQITHGEAVSLIVESRNAYARNHGRPQAAATTDRATLVAAVTEKLRDSGATGANLQQAAERIVDGWLGSSSMRGSQGNDAAIRFQPGDVSFPDLAAAHGSGPTDIGGPAAARVESTVARRAKDRSTPTSLADIKANPLAFARRCPQIDGSMQTTHDRVACGVAALMGGIIMARPEAMVEFATKMLKPDGSLSDEGKRLFSELDTPQARAALAHIRSGTFSPEDVNIVTLALYDGLGKGLNGSTPVDLVGIRRRITELGVSVPRIELERFGPRQGQGTAHWRAVVGTAQFDPWPTPKGEADIITDGTGLQKGSQQGPRWCNTHKVFLDDDRVTINQYATSNGLLTTSDPPLAVVGYGLDRNTHRFRRESMDVSGILPLVPASEQPLAMEGLRANYPEHM